MAQVTGSNARIVYGQESSYGTPPATGFLLPFKDESFGGDIELLSSEVMRGSRNPQAPANGNRSVKGAINTELNPNMGILIKHALGSVSTSGAGPYLHTFKIGALPVGLTVEKYFSEITQYGLYVGVRVNKLSMEFKPSGFIATSFDFAGKSEAFSGTSYLGVTPYTDNGHSPFEGFQASIDEGGSSSSIITGIKFDLENDLQTDQYVFGGGGFVNGLPEGKAKVSGTLTAIFDSMTFLNKAVNGTESSVKLTLTKGTGAGTAGNEKLEIFFPEVRYKASTPVIKDSKGILIELPFEAYYNDSSEQSAIQMKLWNTTAVP